MHIRPVKAYKMNEDFKFLPKLMYMGEYDDDRHLINVYDSSKEKINKNYRDLSMDIKFYW